MTEPERIDIGYDHAITYLSWAPADLPENRAHFGYPLPHVEKAGVVVYHLSKKDGTPCVGVIHFDLPETQIMAGVKWQVQSWEPLTVSPSLLCACGDHGFIQQGRWVPV